MSSTITTPSTPVIGQKVCTLCTKTFDTQFRLNRHLRSSKTCGNQRLHCTVCEMTLSSQQRFESHLASPKHLNRIKQTQLKEVSQVVSQSLGQPQQLSTFITQIVQQTITLTPTIQPTVINYIDNRTIDNRIDYKIDNRNIDNRSVTTNNNVLNVVNRLSGSFFSPQETGARISKVIGPEHLYMESEEAAISIIEKATLVNEETNKPNFFATDSSRDKVWYVGVDEKVYSHNPSLFIDELSESIKGGHVLTLPSLKDSLLRSLQSNPDIVQENLRIVNAGSKSSPQEETAFRCALIATCLDDYEKQLKRVKLAHFGSYDTKQKQRITARLTQAVVKQLDKANIPPTLPLVSKEACTLVSSVSV